MSIVLLEIIFVLFLVVINGFFAMCEMAIVSARKIYLQQQTNKGNKNASIALDLASEPNSFLSSIQIGITLVGVLAGAFGGATIAEELQNYLTIIPSIAVYAETISIAIVVIFITYLSLVIGELVPKRLGLNHAEVIALFIAKPIRFLTRLVSPVAYILSSSADILLQLLGLNKIKEETITEEEVSLMISQGVQTGTFESSEKEIIEKVFSLADQSVVSVMTAKTNIVWIDIEDPIEKIKKTIQSSSHSYFPVAHRTVSRVLGIVYAKELLDLALLGIPLDLKNSLHHPLFIPEHISVLKALESFKQSKKDIALVVDEYGEVQGLITLHDILEAIVGDISYTNEAEDKPIEKCEDGSWLFSGLLSISKIKEILDIEKLPGEEKRKF
ncbi:MAG: HlyC/CorC family transporter, partial [Blastocatellia bacterium]|nr:HlyC/CorC family transporter [Blastocatellia bacterium]